MIGTLLFVAYIIIMMLTFMPFVWAVPLSIMLAAYTLYKCVGLEALILATVCTMCFVLAVYAGDIVEQLTHFNRYP